MVPQKGTGANEPRVHRALPAPACFCAPRRQLACLSRILGRILTITVLRLFWHAGVQAQLPQGVQDVIAQVAGAASQNVSRWAAKQLQRAVTSARKQRACRGVG